MKIKDYKCKCGHNDFFFADKGSQKGIYCSYCGKWVKWADKDEQNLAMKQGKEMYELGKKHGAEEELRRIEKTITERLEAMKGNWPSDYKTNLCINKCIHVATEAIKERKDEINRC